MKLSNTDLLEHLNEQLNFLESSNRAYDLGNSSEAKRIASTLRLLLHDTTKSKSLLSQLDLKREKFYDSSNFNGYYETPWDVITYTGLIGLLLSPNGKVSFAPVLNKSEDQTAQWINFEEWWKMPVIKDKLGNIFSRQTLVLNMADKDGGAHIDPVITDEYASISRQNSLGFSGSIGFHIPEIVPHPERAAIRQIGFEVMRSIVPDYSRNFEIDYPHAIVFNLVIYGEPKKFSRNGFCPCGSGKKYKQCHGKIKKIKQE